MVYVHPALARADGREIAAISNDDFDGRQWQRWSRHRTGENPWRPGVDNLATHFGLVEHWFAPRTRAGLTSVDTATLTLTGPQHAELQDHLFPGDGCEAVAFALCGHRRGRQRDRLLVHELVKVPNHVCSVRTPTRVTWPYARAARRCSYEPSVTASP